MGLETLGEIRSSHHSCLQFAPWLSKITLLPNPAFMTKVNSDYNCLVLKLMALHPPPFTCIEEEHLHR